MILQVAFENQVGRLETDAPGGGGGQVAHVHRVEVAPGGQHVQAPAAWRATGAGRYETPVQGVQQAAHFRRATGVQTRCDHLAQAVDDALHRLPAGFVQLWDGPLQRRFDQPGGVELQALANVTGGAPQRVAQLLQHGRAAPGPGLGQGTVQGVEAQAESLGQGPQQAGMGALAVAPGNA